MSQIQAVLLDVDGTLLDSNDAHAHSWVDAFAAFGIESEFDEIRPLIGMGGDRVLAMWGVDDESDRGRAITTVRGQIFRDYYLPTLKPFPFARELLERMKRDGMKLVVATSSGKDDAKALLKQAGVEDLIDDIVTSSDIDLSKPSPDVVHMALGKANCAPENALFFGDTPYDVEAGRKASVNVVAVRSGGWSDTDLAGAYAIYDDTRDVLAQYGHTLLSPKGRARRASFFGVKRAL